MTVSRHLVAFLLVSLTPLANLYFPGDLSVNAQTPSSARKKGRVKRTASVRSKPLSEKPVEAGFLTAAQHNAKLRTQLSWTFGGKPQKGWYLYEALINQLLDSKRKSGSETFASTLAKWQGKRKLPPSGVLDADTLYVMVSIWQEQRLKERSPATPEQLITAPASDFYDPTRPEELRQVERNTYAAYQRLIRAAATDRSLGLAVDSGGGLAPTEKYLKIVSAFRTREYQEQLRRKSPNAGRAGLAINSPHFTGRALDLYVGGEPVETNDANRRIQVETRVYQWLVNNASRFGFRPYYYEPWHWEFVGP